jgi:hypothetical protein
LDAKKIRQGKQKQGKNPQNCLHALCSPSSKFGMVLRTPSKPAFRRPPMLLNRLMPPLNPGVIAKRQIAR